MQTYCLKPLRWKFIFYFTSLLFFPCDFNDLSISPVMFPLLQSAELPILGDVAKQPCFTRVSRRKGRTVGFAASPLLAAPQNRRAGAAAADGGGSAAELTPPEKGRAAAAVRLLSAPGPAGPSGPSPSRRRGAGAGNPRRAVPRRSALIWRVSPAGRKVPNVPAAAGAAAALTPQRSYWNERGGGQAARRSRGGRGAQAAHGNAPPATRRRCLRRGRGGPAGSPPSPRDRRSTTGPASTARPHMRPGRRGFPGAAPPLGVSRAGAIPFPRRPPAKHRI